MDKGIKTSSEKANKLDMPFHDVEREAWGKRECDGPIRRNSNKKTVKKDEVKTVGVGSRREIGSERDEASHVLYMVSTVYRAGDLYGSIRNCTKTVFKFL